ncbi:helix-turn-helix domain-containing protein [Kitasatospora sp. NPDC056138]|uniref:helix-turn-helix domain-containing protein n=1 Tax=Kitasatospora sp. NPDC056138 TaxID=3345724 RepID=UPI0035DF1CCD
MLGQELRECRIAAGLTQGSLTALYGLSTTTISRYELGQALPRKGYIDNLVTESGRHVDPAAAEEVRTRLYYLLHRALGPKEGKYAREVRVFEDQLTLDLTSRERDEALAAIADQDARLALAAGPGERERLQREKDDLVRREAVLSDQIRTIQQRIDEQLDRLHRDEEPGPGPVGSAQAPPPLFPGQFPPPVAGPLPGTGPVPGAGIRSGPARWTQWALGTALAVVIALLAVIVVLLQKPADHPQPPVPTTSPTTAPGPSPDTSPTPTASASPSTTPPTTAGPSTAGWTVQYHDTSITLPATNAGCGLASMDFDPARGYEGDIGQLGGGLDDLTAQVNCSISISGTGDHLMMRAKAWGHSDPQEPGPDQCADNASRRALPTDVPLSQLTVGTAYCLITQKNSVAWFKITDKPGDNHQGLTVTATLWTQPQNG